MDPQQLPLRDIHLPEPIGWWPPAPGWWIVLALVIAFALLLFYWQQRLPKYRGSLKRTAFSALARVRADYERHGDPQRLVQELSVLFRRVSISYYPRAHTASLIGEAWLRFLEQQLQDGRFITGPGRSLSTAPYNPKQTVDAWALLTLCHDWIEALPEKPLDGTQLDA